MPTTGKRMFLGKGRGYLSAAGPQSRFIIFLFIILITYTIILRIFQKLAEIVDLPVFLPVSLLILLLFIGVAGTIYSHRFIGPMLRIRRAIMALAEGDCTISLRLREADDPLLKELAQAVNQVCEHGRNTHAVLLEAAQQLFRDIQSLREMLQQNAAQADLQKQLDIIKNRQELLDQAVQSYRRS